MRFMEEWRMSGWTRGLALALMLVGMAAALAACGDTWRGLKEDTGQNMEKTGEAIEKAGEAVKP